jgi:hypothetical protein
VQTFADRGRYVISVTYLLNIISVGIFQMYQFRGMILKWILEEEPVNKMNTVQNSFQLRDFAMTAAKIQIH